MTDIAIPGLKPPPRRAPLPSLGGRPGNRFDGVPEAAYEQPIWRQGLFSLRVWLVNDPDALKRILVDNVANYPKTPLERSFFRALLGDGLLSREGEAWRAHRRIMAPSFDPRSVAAYAQLMGERATALADDWAARPDGSELDVADEMTRLTLDIISQAMFSADAAGMTGLTHKALKESHEAAFGVGLLDLLPIIGPRRLAAKARLMGDVFAPMDGPLMALVEARRANPGRTDLLGRLVGAMDEDTGARLTPREVRDEVLTIFVAGHETTAAAMTFVWHLLAHHPAEEAKLHAELDAILGGRTPTHADLPALVYTRRVVDESMRLFPPAPGLSVRMALEADELSGQRLKAGSLVMIAPWVLHRHRRLWDAPERFDPDRFSPERSAGRHRFAYIPFGGGPRVCIGQLLATTEAVLILATLAQRFRLRPEPGREMRIVSRVTIRPEGGLPMRLERRPTKNAPDHARGASSASV